MSDEQKDLASWDTNNPATPAWVDSDVNLWAFEKLGLDNVGKQPDLKWGTAISALNEETKKATPAAAEVNLESLWISQGNEQQTSQEKVILWDSWILKWMAHKYQNNYWRIFLLSFLSVVIFGFASLFLHLYSRYLYFSSLAQPDTTYGTYIQAYKQAQQYLNQRLDLSSYQKYISFSLAGTLWTTNLGALLQDDGLSFVQKKDIIQNALNNFYPAFVANSQRLESLKSDISQYGFFSKELFTLLSDQQYTTTSIKKYLLSLEIIKFSSAMKVFSYLDTFISSLANVLSLPTTQVQEQMQTFVDRGEKDIIVYLNNCYLNPYEIDYDCNMVWDFDRYYRVIDNEKDVPDTNFFKKMMYFIDTKLEQTDVPSFSITFKSYNPTQQTISFTVEVNTFKQDEQALIKKWIANPHIFIISNLLDLIKQSLFVISADIDAKSIKITPKNIKVWSTIFSVNNSVMNFSLPIQKWTTREITDYVNDFTTSQ